MPFHYTNSASFDRHGGGSYSFDIGIPAGVVALSNSIIWVVGAIAGQNDGSSGWTATSPAGPNTSQIVWVDSLDAVTTLSTINIGELGVPDITGLGGGGFSAGTGGTHSGSLGAGLPAGGTVRMRGSSDTAVITASMAVGLWDTGDPFGGFESRRNIGNPISTSGTVNLLSGDSGIAYGVGASSQGSARFDFTGSSDWVNYVVQGHNGSFGRVYAEFVQYTGALTDTVPWSVSGGSFEAGFCAIGVLRQTATTRGPRARGLVIG